MNYRQSREHISQRWFTAVRCGCCLLFTILLVACAQGNRTSRVQVYDVSMDSMYSVTDPLEEDRSRPSFTSSEERLAAMQLVAEDDRAQLWYCNRFMEIAVRDTSSGEIWLSTPFDLEGDARAAMETRNNIHSLVRVVFFDRQQNERRMNSFADAVMHGQFGHRRIQNGVEVQMLIGLKPQLLLVPPAAEADTFEALVVNQIPNDRDRRRLLSYYTRYSLDSGLSRTVEDSLLRNYPGIRENDLYVLRQVNEREMRMLEELIAQTAYSWDDFQQDLEIAGVEVELANPPVFKITVSFTLDNGDLVAHLPAGLIDYDQSMYVLGRIHLLEFFGAGRGDEDGYMLVPDGSGALIHFNTDSTKPVARAVLPVYGEDITFTSTVSRDNIRNAARFPVFGLRQENSGSSSRAWFGIIEEGEAMADIVAQSSQFFSGYETVSPALYYGRDYLVARGGDAAGTGGSFRYIDRNFYQGDWTIRYSFLTGDDADYNGMAHVYRRYLIERNVLQPLAHPDPVMYLDVLGLLQKPGTFIGIPYSRRIRLTTFDQAALMLNDMNMQGVGQVVLRYRGWFNGGLDHTVPNRLTIERGLGGRRALQSLMQTADDLGYRAFFETDFYFIRRLGFFNGYNRLSDGSQTVDGFLAEALPFEMASNAGMDGWTYYTISPNHYLRFFNNFTPIAAGMGINLSMSSAGTSLMADYHRNRPVNSQESLDILTGSFGDFPGSLLVDGGNAYTLPFTGNIMNIPIADSSHINTDISIPFMQLVLHGFVSYSGPAINMSFDPELTLLRNIEFGASLAFMIAYDEIAELKGTPYSHFYSVDYHAWQQIMADMYHRYAHVYRGLSNIPMERHDRLSQGVVMTTFANGTQVLVNYSTRTFEVMQP